MKKHVRRFRGTVILAIVAAAALYTQRVYLGDLWNELNAPVLPPEVTYEDVVDDGEGIAVDDFPVEPGSEEPVVPPPDDPVEPRPEPAEEPGVVAQINLAVPFTSQAPFGVWDEVHEETCEEAALLMVHRFYEGESGRIAPQDAEDELQRLVAMEMDLFGYYKDTTAAETGILAREAYGYARTEVLESPTVDDLKAHVAAGRPIIFPAAGRMLGNPNFSGEGPLYHVFVIRGYANGKFIANDPGTRNGETYLYDEQTLMDAMHDWNDGDVLNGARVALVVHPN